MEEVSFKSTSSYFGKEHDGLKNNTVRVVDFTDERFLLLQDFADGKIKELKIKIVSADYPESFFTRIIKDITFWEDFVIITWYI